MTFSFLWVDLKGFTCSEVIRYSPYITFSFNIFEFFMFILNLIEFNLCLGVK